MNEKILVVEDDRAIAIGLVHNLEYERFEVRHASHGQAAVPMFTEFEPDLIILDMMLPGKSGFDILREIRQMSSDVHIIILSALTNETDKVKGLMMGADDYVSKPFSLRELLARVESSMRRIRIRKTAETEVIHIGNLEINPMDKNILKCGKPVKLSPKATDLLIFFAKNPNRIYSRELLISHVWKDEYEGTARTIDNFVLQIRGQIEENPTKPQFLETVHGMGYRFRGEE